LREVFTILGGPAATPRLRAEFLNGPTFGGVGPLLCTLRSHLIWAAHERHHSGTAEEIELIGVWPAAHLVQLAPPDRPWPEGLPRKCRLMLDGQTLWPHAVEWWGPVAGTEQLLARTEYRNPVVNRPLTEEACARAFAFTPGDAEVADRTAQVTADLSSRAQQLQSEPVSP
jgi:hypothetical protein